MVLAMATGLENMVLYNSFGQMTSNSFANIGADFYNGPWLKLPIHWQKSFVLMIQNAQEPLRYDGFGVVHLDLNTLADVNDKIPFLFAIKFHSVIFLFLLFSDAKKSDELLHDVQDID